MAVMRRLEVFEQRSAVGEAARSSIAKSACFAARSSTMDSMMTVAPAKSASSIVVPVSRAEAAAASAGVEQACTSERLQRAAGDAEGGVDLRAIPPGDLRRAEACVLRRDAGRHRPRADDDGAHGWHRCGALVSRCHRVALLTPIALLAAERPSGYADARRTATG